MKIIGNFLKQLLEPEIALEKIAPLAGLYPHFSSLNDIYKAVQKVTEASGLPVTQKISDGIASLLGFALNPINIALGSAGGLLAKGAVKGFSTFASIGNLGEKMLAGASIGATSLLPKI